MVTQVPIGLDAKRAELESVLGSELFTRAPTLTHLLSYLCEKSWAGESDRIKEYSIGLDVFDRGPDFDQDSDSIVRVQANRLRKRLADYYAGEGASHSLRITIPLGQYVPLFEEVTPPPTGPPATSPAPETEASRIRNGWWWVAGVILLSVVTTALLVWRQVRLTRATPAALAPAAQPIESVGLPAGDELHILAGATRSYVGHAGKLWQPDAWFTGGEAVQAAAQHIWRTQDSSFYRTARQGTFRYDLPLKPGIYELHLHFAETFYGPENLGGGGEGSRRINVLANGKPLLTNFDIVADAGGSNTADVKVFPDLSPASDGKLHLEFSSNDGGKALISAIEVLPGVGGRIRPIRILARQTPYYSNDSQWWAPDTYFKGGQLATDPVPAQGTDDPDLYESHRWGNFSYAIPVAPGRYRLTLYFAASTADDRAQPEQIFDVFCNNKPLLKDFDLRQQDAGIVIRHFANLEPDAQRKLTLEFIPVKGYATVTGIEVLPQ